MDRTSRSALRDRSNDEFAAKSLIRVFIDQRGEKPFDPPSSSSISSSSRRNVVGDADMHTAAVSAAAVSSAVQREAKTSTASRGPAAAAAAAPPPTGGSMHDRPLRTRTLDGNLDGDHNRRNPAATSPRLSQRRSSPTERNAGDGDGSDGDASSNSYSSRINSSSGGGGAGRGHPVTPPRLRPPPPVACTLVAFEPGSLGLELEPIVDEGGAGRNRGGGARGRDGERGRGGGEGGTRTAYACPGRRLGCRVFRVTPEGQAARHGSVHPGDALVVLDG